MKVTKCNFLKDGNKVYQDISGLVSLFAISGHTLILIGDNIYNQSRGFLDCDRIEVFTNTTLFVFDLEKVGGYVTGINAAFSGSNALGLRFVKLQKMGIPAVA